MGVAATEGRLSGRRLETEIGASVIALSGAAERLSELVAEATEWDERIAVVLKREREIEMLATSLAAARTSEVARAAELDQRERALAEEQTRLAAEASNVAFREALAADLEAALVERARALEERAARFSWRWFLRAWSWRPRVSSRKARVCEFFFVPSPHGYKLLAQAGVALTPRARLTGLLNEETTYTVTKIAQLPFDGRWCAYLQVDDWRGHRND